MNPGQRDLRRTAAKEFMNSLDQLGLSLKTSEGAEAAEAAEAAAEPSKDPSEIEAEALALEEAAADIERFIQAQRSKS